jgi:hypothetical protein
LQRQGGSLRPFTRVLSLQVLDLETAQVDPASPGDTINQTIEVRPRRGVSMAAS